VHFYVYGSSRKNRRTFYRWRYDQT
jgi:hypothetical protein